MKDLTYNDLKNRQRLILLICSIVVFLVVAIYTIIWEINYYSKYGYFTKATAVVVDYVEIEGKTYDVFEYEVKKDVFSRTHSDWESKYDIGDEFTIYFDENNPIGIIYNRDAKRIILPIISGVMLLVNIGLLVLYIDKIKNSTMQTNKKSNYKAKKHSVFQECFQSIN